MTSFVLHGADHGGHHPPGGEEGDGKDCQMNMLFHFSSCEKILFNGWNTTSVGLFIASVIGIFCAAFLYEGLRFLREQYNFVQLKADAVHCAPGCEPPRKTFKEGALNKFHLIQTMMYLIQVAFSYLLMLVAMTFNVYLFLSIVLGAFTGYFCFGWIRQKTIDANGCC